MAQMIILHAYFEKNIANFWGIWNSLYLLLATFLPLVD
jgi:hypothetical protein